MRRSAESLAAQASLLLLVALTIFVSALRPVAHPSGRLYPHSGLTRMSLLCESVGDDGVSLPTPAVVVVHSVELVVALTVPLLVLKSRRLARRRVPLRRLRLPARRAHRSPLSD